MKANLIYTIVFTLIATLSLSCSEAEKPQPPVDQAQKSLEDVQEQMAHLAPGDENAAKRFYIIRENLQHVDRNLVAAQEDIAQLNKELETLRPPAPPKPSVMDKVMFWKKQKTTNPEPKEAPAKVDPPAQPKPEAPAPPATTPSEPSKWAFWK